VIKKDKIIKNRFLFKVNDIRVDNPRMTFIGVLYFYVMIPPDIPAKFIDDFLNSHFGVINDMFLELDLAGAIVASRREFAEEIDDKNYIEGMSYKYIVKFHPIFWFGGWTKFMIYFVVSLVLWLFVYKYSLHEYITIDNIKMVVMNIKDYFFSK